VTKCAFRLVRQIICWFYVELLVVRVTLQCLEFPQDSFHSRSLGPVNTIDVSNSSQDIKGHISE
jgi:hypothetical protein